MYEPWQQRVVDEKTELDERIRRLGNFLVTPQCINLPFDDRCLLLQQSNTMRAYSIILGHRIERFTLKGE